MWWPGGPFDGPSLFSGVLDPEAGHFTIASGQEPSRARQAISHVALITAANRIGEAELRG